MKTLKKPLLLAALALLFSAKALADASTRGPGIFMPEVVTESGRQIDHLYSVILVIVSVIFVLSEGFLLWCIFAYRARPGRKAKYLHGSSAVEMILSVVPALILLYLTVNAGVLWGQLRFDEPKGPKVLYVQVFAEQFAWNFRYAGKDGTFGTDDDIMSFNQLAVPEGVPVVFEISSKDVIHSFFIPEAREKQDAVPGLLARTWVTFDHMPVWDRASNQRVLLSEGDYGNTAVALSGYDFKNKVREGKLYFFQQASNEKINLLQYYYDRNSDPITVDQGGTITTTTTEPQYIRHHLEIACAQLCGNSHFAMRGEVLVLPPAEFQRWLDAQTPDSELKAKWNGIWDKYHPEYNKVL